MNVHIRVQILRTFITHLLVHIHQKKEDGLEIAAKIAKCKLALTNLTRKFNLRVVNLRVAS
jgi:hypothetical protein